MCGDGDSLIMAWLGVGRGIVFASFDAVQPDARAAIATLTTMSANARPRAWFLMSTPYGSHANLALHHVFAANTSADWSAEGFGLAEGE